MTEIITSSFYDKFIEITILLKGIPPTPRIEYPSLNIEETADENVTAIAYNLTGWIQKVFLSLGQFDDKFTSSAPVRI